MMNNSLIEQLVEGSFKGTITFPEVVKKLLEDGFESYHVDYLAGESRYYHTNGETLTKKTEHRFPDVAQTFYPERLQAIIRKVQAGNASYPEFLNESAAAGCVYYIVSLKGKMVRYFGRDGGEHIEHFPK